MAEQRKPQRLTKEEARKLLSDYDENDKFFIDKNDIPEGMDYNWKRETYFGKEDRTHIQNLKQRGYWTPVPGSRHPQFGIDADAPIVVDGLMLMERPIELTEERLRRNKVKASAQVQDKLAELEITKAGQLERTKPSVKRTMEIPD